LSFKIFIHYSQRFNGLFYSIFLFIISFIPSFLLYFFFNTQLIKLNQKRIGHLCLDVDAFIKDNILSNSSKKFILIKDKENANTKLFNYFAKYLIIIKKKLPSLILRIFFSNSFFLIDISKKYSEGTDSLKLYKIVSKWGGRNSLFKLSNKDYKIGNSFMKKKKLDTKKFIVCFHSRTSIFSGGVDSDYGQSFRNFSCESFEKAIKFIIKQGGLVIRLGDKDNVKINIKNQNYFDYANYKKNPSLDIFFCASAKFFVGNTSGLFGLSSIFGVPVACCNMIPITTSLVYSHKDIGIPAMYSKNSKLLSFKKIFRSKIRNALFDSDYKKIKEKTKIIYNSPEDIKSLVSEMYNQLNNSFKINNSDLKLQKKFKKNFKLGDSRFFSKSNISYSFLRKYKKLL
jgi:putative glycosyltransferase (TIGR04372 family)